MCARERTERINRTVGSAVTLYYSEIHLLSKYWGSNIWIQRWIADDNEGHDDDENDDDEDDDDEDDDDDVDDDDEDDDDKDDDDEDDDDKDDDDEDDDDEDDDDDVDDDDDDDDEDKDDNDDDDDVDKDYVDDDFDYNDIDNDEDDHNHDDDDDDDDDTIHTNMKPVLRGFQRHVRQRYHLLGANQSYLEIGLEQWLVEARKDAPCVGRLQLRCNYPSGKETRIIYLQ